jgi:class 3 adenylate cyclase
VKHFLSRIILPLAIVVAILAVTLYIELSGSSHVALVKVRVAEYLTVQPNGPRFGARLASQDIVLLDFDLPSSAQLGPLRSYENDAALYRKLTEAGAAVVFDTRSIAVGDPAELERVRPMLDTLVELNGRTATTSEEPSAGADAPSKPKTRLFLEAWLASSFDPSDLTKYSVIAASSPISTHPHSIEAARVRLYPIAYVSSGGLQESAPLRLVRAFRGIAERDRISVNKDLYDCGILSEWHRQYPDQTVDAPASPGPFLLGDLQIPWYPFISTTILVLPGGFWVSHDPLVSDYRRVSYKDVLNSDSVTKLDLQGKIVIIGYVSQTDPFSDSYELPSGIGKRNASEIVALATQTLLDQRWYYLLPIWIGIAILSAFCIGMTSVTTFLKPVPAIMAATALLFVYFVTAIIAYRFGWMMDFALAPAAGVACAILGGTLSAWNNHRAHARVVDMFGRYVPRAVVNQLILQPELDALRLGGTKREVTVLFADIRGFTSFSEKMPPDQVVAELNSILKIMVECTFEHQGTLDKFIGDAILVLFNAPLDQTDHVQRAVRMAVDMQSRLANHSSHLSVGIGVHVGQAVVGNIGTPERMEYTAIGSTVNIASRLCDVAQAGKVIVSKDVVSQLMGAFETCCIGPVKVKGITEPIEVWEIVFKRQVS